MADCHPNRKHYAQSLCSPCWQRRRVKEHPEKFTTKGPRLISWKRAHPERYLWLSAKAGAKRRGLDFSIEPKDVVIPEYCPVLNLKLAPVASKLPNSPSIDRIDNTKGYIKGNVRVISMRANRLKDDATPDEIEMLYNDSRRFK